MASILLVAGIPFFHLVSLTLGVDTTAIALTYISYELAKHPEYFSKLAEEVSIYKDVDDLQSSELEKLPLLNAVIREVLRLYPPAPSPVFARITPPEGTVLEGYRIAGGVNPLFLSIGLTVGQSKSCSLEYLS